MLTPFCLKMPGRVFGGRGSLNEIENIVREKNRIAVFTDKGIESAGLLEVPLEMLRKAGCQYTVLDELPAEPTYMQAQEAIDHFRETGAEMIMAIGGGSVMDIAKLASVAATDGYAGPASDREKTDSDASDTHDSGNRFGSNTKQHRGGTGKRTKGWNRKSGDDGRFCYSGQPDDQESSAEDCGGDRN